MKSLVVLTILMICIAIVAGDDAEIIQKVKDMEKKSFESLTPEEQQLWKDYHTISDERATITLIDHDKTHLTDKKRLLQDIEDKPKAAKAAANAASSVDIQTIINIGKEVWKVIEDNKPVVQTAYDNGNALPKGVTSGADLENWKDPETYVYEVVYKNLLGLKMVTFDYRVTYTWGGDYNGKGKYLDACKIDSKNLNVGWGYTFIASGKVNSVTNVGSNDDPVAAMQLELAYTVKTVMQSNDRSAVYYVRGDGEIKSM